MKKYVYNKTRYNVRVTFVGLFCVVLFLYGAVKLVITRSYVWLAVVVAGGYQIFNTFIAKAIPSEVDLDDHRITFKAYGTTKSFDFKQIKDFRVRSWPDTHKVYVRINKDSNDSKLRGRYWVECMFMNDTLELFNFFIEKECEIHPNTAKTHAIRSNQLSIKEKERLEKELEQEQKKLDEEEARLALEKEQQETENVENKGE